MIVFDACTLVEIARQTAEGKTIQSLALKGEKTISCDLVQAEVASVFRKMTRAAGLTPAQAEQYVSAALSLVDEFFPLADLRAEALRESPHLDLSVYDMFYFVLARRTGATLFTLDRKLMRLCEENGVDCVSEVILT